MESAWAGRLLLCVGCSCFLSHHAAAYLLHLPTPSCQPTYVLLLTPPSPPHAGLVRRCLSILLHVCSAPHDSGGGGRDGSSGVAAVVACGALGSLLRLMGCRSAEVQADAAEVLKMLCRWAGACDWLWWLPCRTHSSCLMCAFTLVWEGELAWGHMDRAVQLQHRHWSPSALPFALNLCPCPYQWHPLGLSCRLPQAGGLLAELGGLEVLVRVADGEGKTQVSTLWQVPPSQLLPCPQV